MIFMTFNGTTVTLSEGHGLTGESIPKSYALQLLGNFIGNRPVVFLKTQPEPARWSELKHSITPIDLALEANNCAQCGRLIDPEDCLCFGCEQLVKEAHHGQHPRT